MRRGDDRTEPPRAATCPRDLAGYYGHEADANHEGTGQTIGFVEFSNYRQAT